MESQKLRIFLYKKIKKIKNKTKYIEILEFIIKQKIDYTTNSNGIFVNLADLDNQQLQELNDIID